MHVTCLWMITSAFCCKKNLVYCSDFWPQLHPCHDLCPIFQTVACIPFMGGVLELGTTEHVSSSDCAYDFHLFFQDWKCPYIINGLPKWKHLTVAMRIYDIMEPANHSRWIINDAPKRLKIRSVKPPYKQFPHKITPICMYMKPMYAKPNEGSTEHNINRIWIDTHTSTRRNRHIHIVGRRARPTSNLHFPPIWAPWPASAKHHLDRHTTLPPMSRGP